MPFMIPLLLQVSLGYTPAQAGVMLIPVAAAAILSKRIGPPLIRRAGYRRVLLVNTLLVGATITSFGLIGAATPTWLLILQLACFGAVNSLQFTAMNTITLFDLEGPNASSGNSLLSMIMMLSMSLGVAVAGGLLAAFDDGSQGVAGTGSVSLDLCNRGPDHLRLGLDSSGSSRRMPGGRDKQQEAVAAD